MKKPLLLLICLSLCFASYAQKEQPGVFVYDYEKVSDAFFSCDIYICTTNGNKREVAVQNKGIHVRYSKEKAKEFADGLRALIDSKTGKAKNGSEKRTSFFLLSDGESSAYFDEKGECVIKFGTIESTLISQDAAKKVMEGLKLAYDKL